MSWWSSSITPTPTSDGRWQGIAIAADEVSSFMMVHVHWIISDSRLRITQSLKFVGFSFLFCVAQERLFFSVLFTIVVSVCKREAQFFMLVSLCDVAWSFEICFVHKPECHLPWPFNQWVIMRISSSLLVKVTSAMMPRLAWWKRSDDWWNDPPPPRQAQKGDLVSPDFPSFFIYRIILLGTRIIGPSGMRNPIRHDFDCCSGFWIPESRELWQRWRNGESITVSFHPYRAISISP